VISPAAAARITVIGLDVDGVLTDGGLILGDVDGQPVELKQYDVQDGLGIYLLRRAGLKVVIVTGRESESVRLRALELNVDGLSQDRHARKLPNLEKLLVKVGGTLETTAFIGDDLPDLAILRKVGMPVCVGNATPEARDAAQVHLTKHGGRGAVREFAEAFLRARGVWERVVEEYVADRSRDIELDERTGGTQ
jgi:3-deoxy-D-manno-octulosonate 8-phosphate phosphatase (KDO 8-P phosphatase)